MKNIKSIVILIVGSFLAAVGMSNFYLESKIIPGGAGGLSTLFYHLFSIPTGVSLFAMSLLFLLMGIKVLGKSFAIRSVIGTLVLSVNMQIMTTFGAVTDDALICTVFGALFYGVGSGLVFASGYNTGGTDILGRIIQHRFPYVSIGKLLMIINGAIILISARIFDDINLMLYGVLAMIISNITIDFVLSTFNDSKIAFIISRNGSEMSDLIIKSFGRGVTIMNGIGGFTSEDKNILLCAIRAKELESFKKSMLEIDSTAFIVFLDAKSVVGNGFHSG